MGNFINKQNKYKMSNIKCPICLLDFNDDEPYINLACYHRIHVNCGKHMCKDYITKRSKINCPLCRSEIKISEINKFLKNNIEDIEIDDPTEWTRDDIINLRKIKYEHQHMSIDSILKVDNTNYTPLIKIYNFRNNYIEVPFYLKIKDLERINIIEHEISNSNLKFDMFLSAEFIIPSTSYSRFLKRFISLYLKERITSNKKEIINTTHIKNDLLQSIDKVRFIVEDISKIKTFDNYNGDILNNLEINEDMNVEIIVKPIIYQDDNNIYYANKLISVFYY